MRRRKIRWNRVAVLLFVLIATLSTCMGAAYYAAKHFEQVKPTTVQTDSSTAQPPASSSADTLTKRMNILIMGLDDGDPDLSDSPRRSDMMLVLSIQPETKQVSILSIPRDTRLIIPGHKGQDKVNNAYFYGGPELAVRTVENLLEIPIPYYLTVNWAGFIQLVDILGGVDLYVDKDMNYEDPYADLSIHLKQGYQHLDGKNAGSYVRFRHDELGDIGRVQRQQKFLKALDQELLQVGTLPKIPYLVNAIRQHVSTNLTPVTMVKLLNTLYQIPNKGIMSDMVPGDFATINNVSYWIYSPEPLKQVTERLFTEDN